jgi:hypothetical protein
VWLHLAEFESLSVVFAVFVYEHTRAVRKVSLFESLSVDLKSERVTNSSKHRPQGLPPVDDGPATISLAEIRCRKRLGGLLKSYSRAAV